MSITSGLIDLSLTVGFSFDFVWLECIMFRPERHTGATSSQWGSLETKFSLAVTEVHCMVNLERATRALLQTF